MTAAEEHRARQELASQPAANPMGGETFIVTEQRFEESAVKLGLFWRSHYSQRREKL